MKWYYAVLACIWAMVAGIDADRGEWAMVAFDLFFLAVVIGATVYFRQKGKGPAAEEAEVLRYLKSPPPRVAPAIRGVDNLDLPVTDLTKKGVEPMPTPGDEYSRLVEEHIKGCSTCQVHEEAKGAGE